MVSEDSDQVVSGLFSIHRLSDFRQIRQARVGPVNSIVNHLDAARELLEIALLSRMQLVPHKERNDRVDQVAPTTHHESIQALSVVVVPPVGDHASHSEEALQFLQARDTLSPLRDSELVSYLIPGLVALATCPRWLPDKSNGEATLSVYKTDNPAELDQSFLLISCTRHVVTVPPDCDDTRSAGFSGVPAYGQMLTARLPVRRAAIYLRTVPDCYYSSKGPARSSGPLISDGLSWSPMRADYLIPLSVWRGARRIVSEDSRRRQRHPGPPLSR